MVQRVDEITTSGGSAWDGKRSAEAVLATEDAFGASATVLAASRGGTGGSARASGSRQDSNGS